MVDGDSAFLTVAEYLRRTLYLCGTKVVCAEGDCGACTVLLGRSIGDEVRYQPIDCCIVFVFQIDACHVITVEGLPDGAALHPVQQAMVDCHGSQCGYCTPGIVMALAGWANDGADTSRSRIALTGNLCRCTGYLPILAAADQVSKNTYEIPRQLKSPSFRSEMQALSGDDLQVQSKTQTFYAPTNLDDAINLKDKQPKLAIVAGATELGVWRNKRGYQAPHLMTLARIPGLDSICQTTDRLEIGASVTWSQIGAIIPKTFPAFTRIVERFGSPQIRSLATVVGNIANGSPIADSLGWLLVMDANLSIIGPKGRRACPINDFYRGYKKMDLAPDEIIERVAVPLLQPSDRLRFTKVSRRMDLDIATFGAAIRIRESGGTIEFAAIALTGVAPTVVRLKKTEAFLIGQPLVETTFAEAGRIARNEIQPISDVRGSSDFRLQLAENVFTKFYIEEFVPEEAVL